MSAQPMGADRTTTICLACGDVLSGDLASVGAMRCQDCRDTDAPLRPELLERQTDDGKAGRLAPAA